MQVAERYFGADLKSIYSYMSATKFGSRRERRIPKALLVSVSACLIGGVSLPAHALVIIPTFDASYNASQQATVNNAIGQFALLFSDPITVNIKFNSMNSGLGQSTTWIEEVRYRTYYNALNADKTTVNDNTALSHISSGPSDPATGDNHLIISYANCLAVSLGCGTTPDSFAGTIGINLGLVDSTRLDGIGAGLYDMNSVVMHEIDEVLGIGSSVGSTLQYIRPEDLFRYDSSGNRTFTTTGDDAYFSIDGGATMLARFSQASDYGDWWSVGAHTARVQDAYGTPGLLINYGTVEQTALDVIGYNLTAPIPEPETYAMFLAGLGLMGFMARRRKNGQA